MSYTRLVIYDRSALRSTNNSSLVEYEERSILVDQGDKYFNEVNSRHWFPWQGPFPTPFINLIQKKP